MSPQSSSTLVEVAQPAAKASPLSWSIMPQRRWENPQFSVGAPHTSLDLLGRYKCWSLKDKSPAHLVWKTVSKAIISLLEDRYEHLDAGGSDLMVEMFMTGRKPTTSSPTILFSCEGKTCRQTAMAMVQKKGILTDHPGVLMAECSKLPRPLALDEESDAPLLPPGIYLSGILRGFGTPVLIYTEEGKPPRKATVGGIITIDHELYGVTAAHAFFPPKEEEVSDNDDVEFAFFGDEQPYDSGDDEELVELTSQASMSSESSQSPGMDESEFSFQGSVTSSSDSTTNERIQLARHTPVIDIDGEKTAVKLGELFTSTEAGERLDWALVKIRASLASPQTTHLLLQSNIVWGEKFIYPKTIGNATSDMPVLIFTGSDGLIEGRLSGVTSFAINSNSHTFQSLLTVRRLVGKFSDGDCGSWVFDKETGDVYGHVVSGYSETGTAYIVPSVQIFQDIQHRVGKPVELFVHAASKARDKISETPKFTIRGAVVHDIDTPRSRRRLTNTYVHADMFASEPSEPTQKIKTEPPASQVYAKAPVIPRPAYVVDIDDDGKKIHGTRKSARIKNQQPTTIKPNKGKAKKVERIQRKPEIFRHDTRLRSSIGSSWSSDSGYASSRHSTASFVSTRIPDIKEDGDEWEDGSDKTPSRGEAPFSQRVRTASRVLSTPVNYGVPTSPGAGNPMPPPIPICPQTVTAHTYPARPASFFASAARDGNTRRPTLPASAWPNCTPPYPPPAYSDNFLPLASSSRPLSARFDPPSRGNYAPALEEGTSSISGRTSETLSDALLSDKIEPIQKPSAPSSFQDTSGHHSPAPASSFNKEAKHDKGYYDDVYSSTRRNPIRVPSQAPSSLRLSNSSEDYVFMPPPQPGILRHLSTATAMPWEEKQPYQPDLKPVSPPTQPSTPTQLSEEGLKLRPQYEKLERVRIEVANNIQRRHSYYVDDDDYTAKIKQAASYQEDLGSHSVPLTAEILRRQQRSARGEGSSKSSGSTSSDGRKSSSTGLTNYGDDENVAIKITGTARVMVGGGKIDCSDGGEIEIKRQERSYAKARPQYLDDNYF
ncbi:hypothetical protein G7Y89_g5690 [Cudoniella acicularis]|uniref:Uncharacterized protein n=1 Tax=Cudoniella acicularis TaxID=354080 RepID=A0A8H4RP64_9HELO|nr:hypothetical protein G7Y89_g5690 [Cudoniella acicularis]